MTEQSGEQPPAAPSSSTSDEHVDDALAPHRVGPVKLAGKRPAPVETVTPKVGPDKLRSSRKE